MAKRPHHDLYARFLDRSLPKNEWTHEAHLIVCRHTLLAHEPAAAIEALRRQISAYNEATGVENTSTSGYHETLTRYYVGAVHHLAVAPIDELVVAPECSREAPMRHWSRTVLLSVDARLGWVEPDVASLPWSIAGLDEAECVS